MKQKLLVFFGGLILGSIIGAVAIYFYTRPAYQAADHAAAKCQEEYAALWKEYLKR